MRCRNFAARIGKAKAVHKKTSTLRKERLVQADIRVKRVKLAKCDLQSESEKRGRDFFYEHAHM